MNTINRRNKLILVLLSFIMILAAMSGLITVVHAQVNYNDIISGEVANLTENLYPMTNIDNPDGFFVKDYANNNYGQNAIASYLSNKKINIFDSDDIVKLLPIDLFKEVGVTQHIGKKWGFFIETWKPLPQADAMLSTVILMKVDVNNDMTSDESKSHLKIRIEPIFQGDFSYVKRGDYDTYSIFIQEKDCFFDDNYILDAKLSFPKSGDEFIVPVPTLCGNGSEEMTLEFKQHNKYYLTDVSNQTSLYNVNQLNPYDDGYNAMDDMGNFFTQSDFAYDGVFVEQGSTNASEVGKVSYDVGSTAFDITQIAKVPLKSVFKSLPFIGVIVSTIDIIQGIQELDDNLKDKIVSEEKRLTYEPQYNSKELQVANGGLHKDEAIAISSGEEGRDLLYGTNDFFEFDYQIHCQDTTVDTRYATMINIGVRSVTSPNSHDSELGEIHRSTSSFSDDLKSHMDSDYKEIPEVEINSLVTEETFHVLPNYNKYLEINTIYSGNYNITFDRNYYAKFALYEASAKDNGSIDHFDLSKLICNSKSEDGFAISGDISLDSDKRYLLIADLKNSFRGEVVDGMYDNLGMKIEFTQQDASLGTESIKMPFNNAYLKFTADKNIKYQFNADSSAVIDILDSSFQSIISSASSEVAITLDENELYYVKLDKKGGSASTVNLTIQEVMNVVFNNIDGIDNDIVKSMEVSSLGSVELPIPQKFAYNFDGWWTSLESYGKLIGNDNIKESMIKDLQLFAKWSPIRYTVIYEENGGEAIADTQYTIEHSVLLDQNASRVGYVFRGWYDNANFSGEAVTIQASGTTGNRTYYAKWTQDTFNVSLDIDTDSTDGIHADLSKSEVNVKYGKMNNLPIPEHIGFTFQGWYKGNIKYTDADGASIHEYTDEEDIVLTAKWLRKSFKFRVDVDGSYKWINANGGELNLTDSNGSIFDYNSGICPNCYITQIKINGATCQNNSFMASMYKEGHIFVALVDNVNAKNVFCWNSLRKAQISNDNEITVELYHEVEREFKIVVEDSDSVNPKTLELSYGEAIEFDQLPTKTGHSFAYFEVSANKLNDRYAGTAFAIGKNFNFKSMPDLSVNVEKGGYAIYVKPIFTPNTYKISFTNVPNSIGSKSVVFGEPYNESSNNAFPVPAKRGYDFVGWYLDANTKVTDADGNANEWNIPYNCTLQAKWELTKYTINYVEMNGGTMPKDYPIYYTINSSTIELPIPTKFGYKFDSWTDGGDVIDTITSGSTGNYRLTANWIGVEKAYNTAGNIVITDKVIIANLSETGTHEKIKFIIADTVDEVTFLGAEGVELYFKSIEVSARTTPLIIRLKYINFTSVQMAVLEASKCEKFTLESVGANYLKELGGGHYAEHKGAVICKNIDITGDELHITAGFVSSDHGIYGVDDANYIMNISIKKFNIEGGSGTYGDYGGLVSQMLDYPGKANIGKVGTIGIKGHDGGTADSGGDGGDAINFRGKINISSSSIVIARGGDGAQGGSGGSGGKGGRGGEGGNAAFLIYGKPGGQGGTGGTGGKGGNGGDGGKGIVATQGITGNYESINGIGGKAGRGGSGGEGGDGGLGGWNLKGTGRYPTGSKGDTGANGKCGEDGKDGSND